MLEKQKINTEPVPIFQVQEPRTRGYHHGSHILPPDWICQDQLYRVWGAVPPATQLWERRRAMLGERREREMFRHIDREGPDGGEDDKNNDEQSIEKVIQSARDVRRLIGDSNYVFQPDDKEIAEETPDLEYASKYNTYFVGFNRQSFISYILIALLQDNLKHGSRCPFAE